MATIDDIISRAQQVRDNTAIGSNTAPLVGGVMTETAEHLRDVEDDVSQQSEDITSLREAVADNASAIETLEGTAAGLFRDGIVLDEQTVLNNKNYINLYNKDDADCVNYSYIIPSSGEIYTPSSPSNLKVSGYIPVVVGESYMCNNTNNHGYAFYDNKGSLISYGVLSSDPMVAPIGASFLRVTVYMAKDGTENIVNKGNTLHSYVDFGTIDINTTTFGSEEIANIKANILTTENINKQGITPNDCDFFQMPSNLYNKDDEDCVNGKYINYTNGNLGTNADLKATGWIRVYPNLYYIANYAGQGAFYDKNKSYISGVQYINSAFQAPANAVWFRGSFKLDSEATNRLFQSSTLLPYVDYATPTIKDKYISQSLNNNNLFTQSVNLYDKDSANCIDKKYMSIVNNDYRISNNNDLKISDYIIVIEGQVLYANRTFNYAFFDENKNYIDGTLTSWINKTQPITVPSGVKYIRFSFYRNYDYQNRVCLDFLHPYVEFGGNFKTPFYGLKNNRQYESTLGSSGVSVEAASLQDSTIQIDSFPISLHNGYQIGFEADVTSFGSADKLTIGKGPTSYGSDYLVIDHDNVTVYHYASGSQTTTYTHAHGLTIDTYIKVHINQKTDDTQDILIETLAGFYSFTITGYYAWNGTPFAKSEGAVLANCKFCINNSLLKKPIWAFGDSYYGEATVNREMYWLKQWGYLNFLIQGYAGQASASAESDLEKCLRYGCPKILIWSLGMNDDNDSVKSNIEDTVFYSNYLKVKSICDNRGIKLILTTIPVPASQNYPNKQMVTSFIKSADCGCRYIDAYKAVGANSSGEWYGFGETYDYQSTDNVHPSEYGARAIATQFLIDVPEILQY